MEDQSNSLSTQAVVSFPPLSRLLPHQLEVMQTYPHRFKVLVWHRRARKTTTAITEIVKQAHLRVGVYWHVFPTYGGAKDAVWRDPQMLFNIIPESLIARKNEQELVIYFKNGSVYQLKGADDPQNLRGAGPVGAVLDEFAEMKAETWDEIIQPIIRANGGWCWFVGTPKGKNHLHKMYQLGLEGHPEWKTFLLKASTSGIIPDDQLKEVRRTSTEAIFNQEYECEFLEGEGAVFRNVRWVMYDTNHEPLLIPREPEEGRSYVMGVDLAKYQDWTVITVYDRATNWQVYQDRFQQLEWPFQKKRIQAVAKHFNNAVVRIDSTGLGDPIADDLSRAGVNIEPIKFTEATKKEMIEKLSIWIDQRKIRMLPIDQTLNELEIFTYEMGPTGKIRYGAPAGYHDDIVISHALAVGGLNALYSTPGQKEPSPIQKAKSRAQDRYDRPEDIGEWGEWNEAA